MLSLDATDKDIISVRVISPNFFRDEIDRFLSGGTVLTHPIDHQLTVEGAKELKQLEESFSNVLDAFSWTSFGVQLAMAYGLKYFWKTINIL